MNFRVKLSICLGPKRGIRRRASLRISLRLKLRETLRLSLWETPRQILRLTHRAYRFLKRPVSFSETRRGMVFDERHEVTSIYPWFLPRPGFRSFRFRTKSVKSVDVQVKFFVAWACGLWLVQVLVSDGIRTDSEPTGSLVISNILESSIFSVTALRQTDNARLAGMLSMPNQSYLESGVS